MPPTDAELKELEELKAMIHGAPVRESAIPLGAVSRFLVGEDNRKAADEARRGAARGVPGALQRKRRAPRASL